MLGFRAAAIMFPAQRPVGARRSHLCFGLDGIDGRASRRFEGYGDLHDCRCHHLVAGLRPTASIHSGRIVATNAATMARWLSSRWPGYCLGDGRRHPPRGLLFAARMLLPCRRRAKQQHNKRDKRLLVREGPRRRPPVGAGFFHVQKAPPRGRASSRARMMPPRCRQDQHKRGKRGPR